MFYRLLARVLAALHILYVVFVVLGSVLVLRYPRLVWLHMAAIAWAVATMTTDLGCALTTWEKSLWRRGGREPYPEGFLQHHVLRRTFSEAHSQRNHAALGLGVFLLNIGIYLAWDFHW